MNEQILTFRVFLRSNSIYKRRRLIVLTINIMECTFRLTWTHLCVVVEGIFVYLARVRTKLYRYDDKNYPEVEYPNNQQREVQHRTKRLFYERAAVVTLDYHTIK